MEAQALRVAIVEDNRPMRESLRTLLAGSPGFACVLACGSVEEALAARLAEPPQVLLLDINLPGMRGSLGARPLLEKWPPTLILMHTVYEEGDKVFESLLNGASGYILKRTAPAQLLEAIREACAGGAPMSPEIARKVVALLRQRSPQPEPYEELGPQEVRLLALLARGHSYGEAAKELRVSVNTVRSYIRSVYEKLHAHTKAEAVAKAMRSGIL